MVEDKIGLEVMEEVSKTSLTNRIDIISKFNLSVTNLPSFRETVRADSDGLENYLMIKQEQIAEKLKKLDVWLVSPEIRNENWEDDIWFKFYNIQKEVVDLQMELDTIRAYYGQYLTTALNKVSQLTTSLRKEFTEIQKIQAENSLLEKFVEIYKKDKEEWLRQYATLIEAKFEGVNKMWADMTKRLVDIDARVNLFTSEVSKLKTEIRERTENLTQRIEEVNSKISEQ